LIWFESYDVCDNAHVQLASFHVNLDVYVGLERYVDTTDAGVTQSLRTLHITAEHDCRRLHCTMRDLSSLLQALGRLSHHFIDDDKFTAWLRLYETS